MKIEKVIKFYCDMCDGKSKDYPRDVITRYENGLKILHPEISLKTFTEAQVEQLKALKMNKALIKFMSAGCPSQRKKRAEKFLKKSIKHFLESWSKDCRKKKFWKKRRKNATVPGHFFY